MGRRVFWIRLAAVLASALLVAGLFPPFRLSALVWIALAPLLGALWSLDGKRTAWKGFGLGWLAGSVSFLIQFHWLAVVSPIGVVVLPLYLGLFWGLFGAYAGAIANPWRGHDRGQADPPSAAAEVMRSLRYAFAIAACWAGLEWLRGWLFTGFGWNGLGVAFHETLAIAQAADLFGVTGLSMLPVFLQAVLVQTGRRMMVAAHDGRRRTRVDFLIAAGLVAFVLCYGIVRLASEGRGESIRLKALLVQINIPQEAARPLWEPHEIHLAYEEETIAALDEISAADEARLQSAIAEADEGSIRLHWPDWVVWPESALAGRILRAEDGGWATWRENADTIARVREAGRFHLIYGINELEGVRLPDGNIDFLPGGRAWNSLAVMDPEDNLQTFRKYHLVIFGETIPFVDTIPLLRKIYEQQAGVEYGGSFTPGESFDPLPVSTLGGDIIGGIPTVCFEDSVPRLVRRFVRPGPQIILNVTNDGWFKESAAAAQHFANARFRAIELRRPMLRCANTGVSAAIDSTGSTAHPDTGRPQVLTAADGSHFTRGALLTELDIPVQPSFSLYALTGDWLLLAIALGGCALGWVRAGNNT